MAEEDPQPVDLWEVLDEAEESVEKWPAWQQRYEADVFAETIWSAAAEAAAFVCDSAIPTHNSGSCGCRTPKNSDLPL